MKKHLIILLLIVAQMQSNVFAQLLNTGWKSPTALHAPNNWTNPQNVFVSDDVYATVAHQSGCRCPFMDLSWDDGVNFTTYNLFGPYGTMDSFDTQGDSTDDWGHTWTTTELSDPIFVLRIWNPSTLIRQGYAAFQFGIPAGSSISGIEVRVEDHGDSNYVQEFVDVIEARVFYNSPNAVNEIYAGNSPVNVYPNPAHNTIHFLFGNNENRIQLQIINLSGQVVQEKIYENIIADVDYNSDINRLSPGIYFVNFISGQRTVNTRIIKQ